jgi:hypothetical protein
VTAVVVTGPAAAAAALRGARRISVIGCPGAGKSTLARSLAAALGLRLIHLDDLYWGPGWSRPEPGRFEAALAAVLAQEGWIVDGNYLPSLPGRLARSDAAVFLDVPARRCAWRVLRRGAGRLLGERASLPQALRGQPLAERIRIDPRFLWKVARFSATSRPAVVDQLVQFAGHGRVVRVVQQEAGCSSS